MKLHFLGANQQVTGSRYLLDLGDTRIMIDCGLFQEREFRNRNWETSPVPPASIDCMLLTHAHLDHSGLIPRLVRNGFNGPIHATAASVELADIIMSDSAKIQEEDAKFKRKRHEREKRKGPHPIEPLYLAEHVDEAMTLFKPAAYNEPVTVADGVTVTFHDAGHILGSAMLEVQLKRDDTERTIVFSGDIGQRDKPIIRDPSLLERADYVIMESTYGDRDHGEHRDVEDQLCNEINAAVDAGGNIIIPTFAVERAQELIYHIARLVQEDRIPNLLTFLDSPMAVNVTDVFSRHRDNIDEEARAIVDSGESLLRFPGLKLVRSTSESKAINRIKGSCIIMAGSGMCTAGRIKHHLVSNISRPESTIVFVGFQAHGTLGREILNQPREVRIHGQHRPVRARIAQIHGFSAHADRSGLLRWIGHFQKPVRKVFLTHGEEDAASNIAEAMREDLRLDVSIPEYQSTHDLV